MGEASYSWGGGPSGTVVGAAEEAGAVYGATVGAARAEILDGLPEREGELQVA
jgi:hypothetical protein